MIAVFVKFGWIPSVVCLSSGDVATGLQNFLMCFEMFLVALLHIIAYPYLFFKQRREESEKRREESGERSRGREGGGEMEGREGGERERERRRRGERMGG